LNYNGRFTKTGWEGSFRARDFDIQLFQPFLPTLQKLQGRLNAAYTTLPSDSTEQQSYIRLDDVNLQEPHIPIQASEIQLILNIDPQQFTLNQFTGKLNGGGFRGAGSLHHNRFRVTEGGMHIDAWDLSVNREKTVQFRLDSLNLDFTTQSGQNELSGFMILDESRFTQSIRLTDLLVTMDRVRRPWKKNSEFQRKTALNLHIHNLRPFWVDNNLAKLNMNGNFSIYGTLASPYILGQISVQKGYVLYLDRKFQVKEGRLNFIDPESPYPEVTFQAEKEMKSYETFSGNVYQITFGLTGPANRVKPSWTSEPPLSEPDVLSLLTLGATRKELTRDEGSGNRFTNVLQDRLTLLSSQKVSSYATKTLGNLFGLENVAVEGNLFQFGKSWGPQLLASKKLSDRLSVTYKTAVGQSNTQEIRLDYKLTNRFSLEGQTDQKGKSGIDILYKLKY
jgi:autotransporter translocation and assembly factor TamB